MYEDDKEADESRPEPEGQPLPESEADESQPQGQSRPASEVSESQPAAGTRPLPARPIRLPPTQQQKGWQYLTGLALGLIPLLVFLVGFGITLRTTTLGDQYRTLSSVGPLLIELLLYVIELVVTIVLFSRKTTRFAGYGLLTAFLITPIVTPIGCAVLPNLIHA